MTEQTDDGMVETGEATEAGEGSHGRITLKDLGLLLVIPGVIAAIFAGVWAAQNGPRPDAVGCTVESAEYDRGSRGREHVEVVSSCGTFTSSVAPSEFTVGETYDFTVRGWLNPIISGITPAG